MKMTFARGNWNILKGRLKQKWAKHTHNMLKHVEGKTDELIGRIQKRTGASRAVVEKALREWDNECNCGTCLHSKQYRHSGEKKACSPGEEKTSGGEVDWYTMNSRSSSQGVEQSVACFLRRPARDSTNKEALISGTLTTSG